MLRILQVVNNMHRAGLETMLMNYYRNIDREQIQFDFLTHRPERDDYDDEIESLGGKIYHAPRLYPQNYPAYFKYMKSFFAEHPEYRIVHSHIDTMSYLPLLSAKNSGVDVRISHSHTTSIDKDFKLPLKYYFRSQITKVATHYCACGQEAGEFLFPGKEFTFIPNAIDAERFLHDEAIRRKKRAELGVDDKLVIGHVGRFSYPKNHKLLIEIFNRLLQTEPDSVLILTGVGEKTEEIRNQVHSLSLDDKVMCLGSRSDVNELYQAMDVFVMPSFFEGIPVVGVEAQFSGLPCIFSDRVPKEVAFSSKCSFISLDADLDDWVEGILKYRNANDSRGEYGNELLASQYNIKNAKKILQEYYLDLAASLN